MIVRKELSDSSFAFEPHFFIKDHLGSVRAVVKADGEKMNGMAMEGDL